MNLKGKSVLVTGSAVRIGKAVALALARRGARLIIHYRHSSQEAQKTIQEVKRLGARAVGIQADLADLKEVEWLAREAWKAYGRLDVLINNAAVFPRTPLSRLTAEDWESVMAVNLRAPFWLAKELGLKMAARGSGKIINLADFAAERPWVDYIPYCISKAGVIAMTRALAKAFAPKVQVNAISPGPILTPADLSKEERERAIRATPLKRWGSPGDIAQAVLFLLEGTDFMTGAVLSVDGGRSIA